MMLLFVFVTAITTVCGNNHHLLSGDGILFSESNPVYLSYDNWEDIISYHYNTSILDNFKGYQCPDLKISEDYTKIIDDIVREKMSEYKLHHIIIDEQKNKRFATGVAIGFSLALLGTSLYHEWISKRSDLASLVLDHHAELIMALKQKNVAMLDKINCISKEQKSFESNLTLFHHCYEASLNQYGAYTSRLITLQIEIYNIFAKMENFKPPFSALDINSNNEEDNPLTYRIIKEDHIIADKFVEFRPMVLSSNPFIITGTLHLPLLEQTNCTSYEITTVPIVINNTYWEYQLPKKVIVCNKTVYKLDSECFFGSRYMVCDKSVHMMTPDLCLSSLVKNESHDSCLLIQLQANNSIHLVKRTGAGLMISNFYPANITVLINSKVFSTIINNDTTLILPYTNSTKYLVNGTMYKMSKIQVEKYYQHLPKWIASSTDVGYPNDHFETIKIWGWWVMYTLIIPFVILIVLIIYSKILILKTTNAILLAVEQAREADVTPISFTSTPIRD